MRKLATAAAVSLALASGGAFGLGLGDIEMRSALNQPMSAEIRLTSVQPGELDGMIVQLASAEAFARAGIDRSTALTSLRFSVDQSSGVPLIRVTSEQPIIEPFLNFLLEVEWPQGSLVREYTVLLDPPVFFTPSATERNTLNEQPALVDRGDEALVVPTPIEREGVADPLADDGFVVELFGDGEEVTDTTSPGNTADDGDIVSLDGLSDSDLLSEGETVNLDDGGDIVSLTDLGAPNTAALEEREAQQAFDINSIEVELADNLEEVNDSAVVADSGSANNAQQNNAEDGSTIVSLDDLSLASEGTPTEVEVNTGDTLFEIAQSTGVQGASVQQMMLALLAANESAFINNNINLLRAGSILRIPSQSDANQLTQTQALAAIGEQNQLWQEYRDNLRGSGVTQVAQNQPTTESADVEEAAESVSNNEATELASVDTEANTDGLSAEARAILDNAREEILNREELRIVADNAPTSTVASATADETGDNNAERLGEVNRKLQLAREELSSTRLQSDDLSDQAGALQSTAENLDALVSLRQNEIAQLEAQLADARTSAEESESAEAAGNVADAVADSADTAAESATDAVTDAASELAANASETGSEAVDAVSDAAASATDAVQGAGDQAVALLTNPAAGEQESVGNALTEAGETLGEVELDTSEAGASVEAAAGDVQDAASDVVSADSQSQTTWYQDILNDPKRLMIAGVGALGLLGVLGTLLFRRKRRDDVDEDELFAVGDNAEFMDDDEASALQAEMSNQPEDSGFGAGVGMAAGAAAGAAAAVGGAAAAGSSAKDAVDDLSMSGSADDTLDVGSDLGSETQAVAGAISDEGLDNDDTISEVDVYLAYGLHGQAEDLLSKAIDRDPNNQQYAQKLLQTLHAQGNGEGFQAASADFHARFGGEANPAWPEIAAMGAELRPGDELYSSAVDSVDSIGNTNKDGTFGDTDFLPAQEGNEGSVSRDFGSSDTDVNLDSDDESLMMDQSLDPAFAFDEADLEATGDFSQIADEIAAEDDGSIDFPGMETGAGIAAGAAAASNLGGDLSVEDFAEDLGSDLAAELPTDLTSDLSADLSAGDLLGDALTMDDLDDVGLSADDLTLDLDQLSGDLELDSAELMNSDLSDLDIPDLTAGNDTLIDGTGVGGASDEMDTMLDLAKAYIDMGDKDSASSALGEIVKSGSPEQVTEAETLLRKIS